MIIYQSWARAKKQLDEAGYIFEIVNKQSFKETIITTSGNILSRYDYHNRKRIMNRIMGRPETMNTKKMAV